MTGSNWDAVYAIGAVLTISAITYLWCNRHAVRDSCRQRWNWLATRFSPRRAWTEQEARIIHAALSDELIEAWIEQWRQEQR